MVHGLELQIGRKRKCFYVAWGDSAVIVGPSVEYMPKCQDFCRFNPLERLYQGQRM
jgi:hypothetical protein